MSRKTSATTICRIAGNRSTRAKCRPGSTSFRCTPQRDSLRPKGTWRDQKTGADQTGCRRPGPDGSATMVRGRRPVGVRHTFWRRRRPVNARNASVAMMISSASRLGATSPAELQLQPPEALISLGPEPPTPALPPVPLPLPPDPAEEFPPRPPDVPPAPPAAGLPPPPLAVSPLPPRPPDVPPAPPAAGLPPPPLAVPPLPPRPPAFPALPPVPPDRPAPATTGADQPPALPPLPPDRRGAASDSARSRDRWRRAVLVRADVVCGADRPRRRRGRQSPAPMLPP